MKSLLFKSIIVVLLVLGISNYFIYLQTGRSPLLSVKEYMNTSWLTNIRHGISVDKLAAKTKDKINSVGADVSNLTGSDNPTSSVQVYKWTDSEGQVHFGDKPMEGSERVNIDMRETISQPTSPSLMDTFSGRNSDNGARPSVSESTEEGSPIEKARAAVDALNARAKEQEAY